MPSRTPTENEHVPRIARATGWRIARIAGIDVWIDRSWIISLALLSFYAYDLIARDLLPGSGAGPRVLVSVLFGLILVACILVHEFAHSVVARRYGLPVRRITLFAFGGVSQIEREAAEPGAEYFIALAGPLASVIIAAVLAGIARLLYPHFDHYRGAWGAVALLNFILAVFNLIPAFPMDGGRILRSALWAGVRSRARATRWAALSGRAFAAFLIAAGAVEFVAAAVRGQAGSGFSIWAVFVGLFLYNAASASQRREGGDTPNEPPAEI